MLPFCSRTGRLQKQDLLSDKQNRTIRTQAYPRVLFGKGCLSTSIRNPLLFLPLSIHSYPRRLKANKLPPSFFLGTESLPNTNQTDNQHPYQAPVKAEHKGGALEIWVRVSPTVQLQASVIDLSSGNNRGALQGQDQKNACLLGEAQWDAIHNARTAGFLLWGCSF